MNTPLRVLHLEDDVRDTELLQATLEAERLPTELTRVETEHDFVAALKRATLDLILADYTLPSFDGLSALRLAQEHAPDVPFIFVSGTLGEDVAIEALKKGATDYVLKARLARLGPSITRALREAREKSERKQTQEQLNREQQRFMDLVNSVDGIVWEANAGTFAFSFVSEQAERVLGYTIERWLKEPTFWKDHLHPEDRDWAVEFCVKATAEKRNHDFEYRMIAADGRTVWFHDVVTVVVEDDRPKKLRGVMVNTTERKRAEEAVRRSEKELRDVFETIPAMVWRTSSDGTVDFMNHRWQEVTGLPLQQAFGWNWAKVLHPDDRERVFAGWESAIKKGQAGHWENRLRGADGQYRSWFIRNVPLRDEHGNVVKWYGTAIDIEDRKRAEEALRQSEKELRDLIGTIPAMAFVTRADGSNEFVSRQWIEFSGLSAEQSAGSGWEVTLHPDDVEEHVAKWRAAWTSGKPFESEARHRDAHGNYRSLLVRAVPLRDERGSIVKWYGAAIDVEDRKRAEEQVRRSEAYLAEAQRLTHTGSRALKPGMSKPFYWSEEMFRILGFDPEQGLPDNETVWQRVHPEDLKAFMREQIDQVSSGNLKTDIANDYRVVLPDGTVKYIHGRSHPVFDEAGNVVEYVGTSVDVTERKHSEALQNGEKRLLEMIATGVPLKRIMNALCLIIEEQRPGTLASVLLMNPDDIHLNVVAAPNLPNDFTQQMESLPIGPCAGSCGTAAYRQSPVMVSDIKTDPLWEFPKHRAFALKHGLRASWSNPVLSSKGQVLGTFCVYHREPGTPTSQDLELMELATHVARVAIERDRAEKAVRASEQLARSHVEVMMRSLDVLATEAAPEKFIAEMLRTIGQRLHARSVLLWLRDPQDDSLHLRLVLDDGQQVAPHVDHPFVKDPHSWKRILPFQEMLFTKGPVVCDNLEQDSRIGAELREYMVKRGRKRFLAIPMFVLGEVRGFIGIQHSEQGAYRAEEVELAQALAHHVMIAIHEDELGEQRRHAVILEERTRMARDIHDTLAQGFTGVIMQLEAVADAISRSKPKKVNKCLQRASDLARQSLNEARRSVHALRPEALERVNFWEALKGIIKNTAAGTPIRTKSKLRGKLPMLRLDWQENLMRIGQEALTNTLKYAHADTFETRLVCHTNKLRLEFQDDGDGFNVNDQHDGVGFTGMRERVAQMGGELRITSARGKGTKITVALRCNGQSMS